VEAYLKILAVVAATFGTAFVVIMVTAFSVSLAKDVLDEIRSRSDEGGA